MNPVAIAIALGYGFVVLAAFNRRGLRLPWVLAAFGGGALAFAVAVFLANPIQQLLAAVFGWDMDAYTTTLGIGVIGAAVGSAVDEVFKLVPALVLWSLAGESGDALAFGAAAGAGFGVVGASQVIRLALLARALPISSPAGFALALLQQLAFVAVNAASTALAAYGASRQQIGAYLLAAILFETLFATLGLLYGLQLYSSGAWTALSAACAFLLLGGVVLLERRRAPAGTSSSVP
jgi:hypothetical protein